MNDKKQGDSFVRRTPLLSYSLHGLKRSHLLDESSSLTIGRSKDCDICIPHPNVERLQCRIERTTGGELILFSESDDVKTIVNGYPVEFKTLQSGDEIRISSITLNVGEKLVLGAGRIVEEPIVQHEISFRSTLKQSIKQAPWLSISAIIHLMLILFMFNVEEIRPKSNEAIGFYQDEQAFVGEKLDLQDDPKTNDSESMEDAPTESFADMDPLLFDSIDDQQSDDPKDYKSFDDGGEIQQGPLSKGVSANMARLLNRSSGDRGLGQGNNPAWNEHVGKLRRSGVDVAILFDSTGSMEGFIREAKTTIKGMVHVLKEIAPNLAISLITYKGEESSSEYVIANTPLVRDPYELLNFMNSVEVSGGSAEGYAAIKKALETAYNNLSWRDRTEKVIVIIGDAPGFPNENKACLEIARKFKGGVSTIYLPSSGITRQMAPETERFYKKLASVSKGTFLRHDSADSENVVRRILSAILGPKWQKDIESVFNIKRSESKERFLRRKAEAGDINWFFKQIRKPNAPPELIDMMVERGGRQVAKELWKIFQSEELAPWLLQRSIYLLHALTGHQIDYTISRRDRLTLRQVSQVKWILKRYFGKEIFSDNTSIPPPEDG